MFQQKNDIYDDFILKRITHIRDSSFEEFYGRVRPIIQFFDWIFIKKFYSLNKISGVSGVVFT